METGSISSHVNVAISPLSLEAQATAAKLDQLSDDIDESILPNLMETVVLPRLVDIEATVVAQLAELAD